MSPSESPPKENTLLRFKTFWIVLGVMLLFAVLGVSLRAWNQPNYDLFSEAEAQRQTLLEEVREAQRKQVVEMGLDYRSPEGGHLATVTVPDDVLSKAVAHLKANRPHASKQVVPGSKTQLEQSKLPDPALSEFLKN